MITLSNTINMQEFNLLIVDTWLINHCVQFNMHLFIRLFLCSNSVLFPHSYAKNV